MMVTTRATKLAEYKNGDYDFTLYSDGTLVRSTEVESPRLLHPSSIDVKITDYCDMGCMYCHESSTTSGIHGDLDRLLDVISVLPAGVECSIGGGNALSHPHLIPFLEELKRRGLIANITVNQGHLKPYQDLLTHLIQQDLVKGVGVSINSYNSEYLEPLLRLTDNIVYHVIAGVNKVSVISRLMELSKCKILILGYKTYGFGVDYHNPNVDTEILRWKRYLPQLIDKCTISFDNLAIEQLNVKRLFTTEGWDHFYMGDDFCFTMYLDAVRQEYAPTSRSDQRTSFNDCSLLEYFQN
jgi:Radical SAM superfamily